MIFEVSLVGRLTFSHEISFATMQVLDSIIADDYCGLGAALAFAGFGWFGVLFANGPC